MRLVLHRATRLRYRDIVSSDVQRQSALALGCPAFYLIFHLYTHGDFLDYRPEQVFLLAFTPAQRVNITVLTIF